jgi:hypothetical protein
MLYGTVVWDPILIIAQICAIQALGYSIWCIALLLCVVPVLGASLGQANSSWLFYVNRGLVLSLEDPEGLILALTEIIAAVGVGCIVAWIAARAKKCMDFSCTSRALLSLLLGHSRVITNPTTLILLPLSDCSHLLLHPLLCVLR